MFFIYNFLASYILKFYAQIVLFQNYSSLMLMHIN